MAEKKKVQTEKKDYKPPVSLAPLSFDSAVGGLLATKPKKTSKSTNRQKKK